MKKTKIILIIVLAILALLLTTIVLFATLSRARYYFSLDVIPSQQENTSWRSDDGEVFVYIDEDSKGKLTFTKNDETAYYFVSGPGYIASVYCWDVVETNVLTDEARYEKWRYTKCSENSFTITVEQTTFFDEGDNITFYKVN